MVSGFETRKAKLRIGRAEVIATSLAKLQKLFAHQGTYRVLPSVFFEAAAKTVSLPTRYRRSGATEQR